MVKTYDKLKKDEICIYQAFENVTRETHQQMATRINAAGYDADDSDGVAVLADAYGMTQIEAFHASDLLSGEYNLEKSKGYVLVVSGEGWALARVRSVSDPKGLVTGSEAKALLTGSPESVNWHAIFARTDGEGKITWIDKQKIFATGPVGHRVAIAITS